MRRFLRIPASLRSLKPIMSSTPCRGYIGWQWWQYYYYHCYCYYYYHYFFCFYFYNQPLREKHCCVGPDIQCPSQHLEIIMWGKNLSEQYYPFVKLRHPVVCAGLLAVQACSVLQERSHQVFVVFRDYDVVGLVLPFEHVGADLLDEGDCPAKGDRPCLWAHLFVPLLVVALLNSL